jgi:thioredoxin reductase
VITTTASVFIRSPRTQCLQLLHDLSCSFAPTSSTMNGTPTIYDALIVGGGPAGLSTALGLARQLYTAVLFDSQQYRNYPADHMHNVLTWDHRAPAEFRASAKEEITGRYKSIEFRTSRIESIRKLEDGTFEAVDSEHNKIVGKKVVVATGVTDVLPDIKGFGELWGKSMYACPCRRPINFTFSYTS